MYKLFGWMDGASCSLVVFIALLVWGAEYVISTITNDWWAVGQAVCSTPVLDFDSEHRAIVLLTCGKIQAHTDAPDTFKAWAKGEKKFNCVIYRSGLARCK